jgi:hypothetical protein
MAKRADLPALPGATRISAMRGKSTRQTRYKCYEYGNPITAWGPFSQLWHPALQNLKV